GDEIVLYFAHRLIPSQEIYLLVLLTAAWLAQVSARLLNYRDIVKQSGRKSPLLAALVRYASTSRERALEASRGAVCSLGCLKLRIVLRNFLSV
ncbi:MAG TPA: hypothetical protein VKX46_08245, partial [Ktedonobacteraceae bacterium]|nr:hypothetical protein [Ktedonobacteraceae bacterium]